MIVYRDQVFCLGDSRFLICFSEEDVDSGEHPDFNPVTVIPVTGEGSATINRDWLLCRIEKFQNVDDVFQTDFLEGVVLYGPTLKSIHVESDARELLESMGTRWISCLASISHDHQLLPGPHVIFANKFREVWKIYNDINGAFVLALKPEMNNPLRQLTVNGNNDGSLDVAVPSRLRSHYRSKLPLAGLRLVVKDNYHLKGLKTSLCNRAYHTLYPPQPTTAACIQQVIEAGAIIIGKTKLNSFGVWEEPTEYIDYQAPWNPRADGYQSPGGSSTGSAVAIAAYEWIDIAIGSDTAGSISRPGLWCGCFAMRPSYGVLPTEGLVHMIEFLDAPGFLGRDLHKLRDFAVAWYGAKLSSSQKPSAIIWPVEFWSAIDTEQCDLAKEILHDLEELLQVSHNEVRFEEEWEKSPPDEAKGLSLQEFMEDGANNIWYDEYRNSETFRRDYWKQYEKAPYVSPPVCKLWDFSKKITKAERDSAVERLEIFKIWFNKKVLDSENRNALILLPIENMTPRYRDEPPAFSRDLAPLNCLFLAPLLQAPELVVPVGQIPYLSKVTKKEEFLPFAVGLLGSPGEDLMLMDTMIRCFEMAGRPTKVCTGQSMYEK